MSKTKKIKMPNMKDILAEMRKEQAIKKQKSDQQSKILFDFLEQTNLLSIEADFDGCGDSGQINRVKPTFSKSKSKKILTQDLNKVIVPSSAVFDKSIYQNNNFEALFKEGSIQLVIEEICYDILEAKHGGWEINEGSFGRFNFDVPTRKITLEFNERQEVYSTTEETY